jgi:hypothetical protein
MAGGGYVAAFSGGVSPITTEKIKKAPSLTSLEKSSKNKKSVCK